MFMYYQKNFSYITFYKPTTMRKHFYHLFIFSLISFSFIGCKKDPTKNATLPAASQEGKNTIGFTINGEVWVPYEKCAAFSNPCREITARYGTSGGAAPNGIDFGFTRRRNGLNTTSYLLITSSGVGTITTIGNKIDSVYVNFTAENSIGNNDTYSGGLPGSNFIITKVDQQDQIISGKFEFILRENNGSGRTITLKDGRFDFKFNACHCSN